MTLWTPPNTKAYYGRDLFPPPDVLPLKGGARLKHSGEWMVGAGSGPGAKVYYGPSGLTVLVSLGDRDGFGPLLHMSMSLPRGYPDWDLIYDVTRAVFGEHVDAMMPIPREEAFIHGALESQRRGKSRQVFHVIEMPRGWPRED